MTDSDILDRIYERRIKDGSGWWVMDSVAKEYYWKVGAQIVINYINANMPPYGLVIDYGCGVGNITYCMQIQTSAYTIGYDVSKVAVEYAKKRYGGVYGDAMYYSDIEILRKDNIPASLVCAIEVIEHIRPGKINAELKTIRSLLKPGGELIVTTPNKNGWIFRFENKGGTGIKDDEHDGYEKFLTTAELKGYLNKAGFEVCRVQYTKFMGEMFFGMCMKYGVPDWIVRVAYRIGIVIERIAGWVLPGWINERLGFTQILYCNKVNNP